MVQLNFLPIPNEILSFRRRNNGVKPSNTPVMKNKMI